SARRPHSTSPPSSRSLRTIALATLADPPRATGHPPAWAEASISIPTAPVPASSSARRLCAAAPASSALASRPWKKTPASASAESRPGAPNRARSNGWRRARGVAKPVLAERLGAEAAARSRIALENEHRPPRLGDGDGRGEPVGPGADDHGVELLGHASRVTFSGRLDASLRRRAELRPF